MSNREQKQKDLVTCDICDGGANDNFKVYDDDTCPSCDGLGLMSADESTQTKRGPGKPKRLEPVKPVNMKLSTSLIKLMDDDTLVKNKTAFIEQLIKSHYGVK